MGRTKKAGAAIGSDKIKNLHAMVDSDSDSYGSEGGLKPKVVVVKTRGGKKRNKANKEDTSQISKDEDSNNEEGRNFDNEPVVLQQEEADIPPTTKPEDQSADRTSFDAHQEEDNPEEKKHVEESSIPQNQPKKNPNFKPIRGRHYSPPMIKEYDPNEENAKTRAKKRAEEIKKREDIEYEIDKSNYPDHPTPWKGKPSDFFLVHETRRGTNKVLNNSQKEFILVYYPDSKVDPVMFMEFLYKQAKDHEDKERWAKQANDRDLQQLRGKTKTNKQKRNRAPPQYIQEIAHTNAANTYFDSKNNVMSFESMLNDKNPDYTGPDHQLVSLRRQINEISTTANTHFTLANAIEQQHSTPAFTSIGAGFCAHCHQHARSLSVMSGFPSNAALDETEIQRQNILMQICEAKKRQAKFEAEDARRLRDEARRLQEQATILELEAQRPLLEAKKLEQEAMILEQQFLRLPQHSSQA